MRNAPRDLKDRVRRTAVVVSVDPEVRADWARYFEALGMRTLRCVGPHVQCILLDGRGARCPLHAEADLVVYDRSAVTPELALRLMRVGRSLPVAFAEDRVGREGCHEPSITAFASDADGGCIGPPPDGVAR